jgi:regulator of protease activity HflC (stomatin/prohibitin superfamily)
MNDALGWVGQLVEWVGQFIPRWEIVNTTQGAVKFVRGAKVVALAPGLHWYWPATTEFTVFPTARQATTLPSQTLLTSDGEVVAATAMIVFEVVDVADLVAHTYDPDNTVEDIAQAAVHDVLCQQSWKQLREQAHSRSLHTLLRQEAQRGLKPYGVRVLRVSLVDMAPCYVLRLMQSPLDTTEESVV